MISGKYHCIDACHQGTSAVFTSIKNAFRNLSSYDRRLGRAIASEWYFDDACLKTASIALRDYGETYAVGKERYIKDAKVNDVGWGYLQIKTCRRAWNLVRIC